MIQKSGNSGKILLKSGLWFHSSMLILEGKEFIVTGVVKPGADNSLKVESYKIGGFDLYLTPDLFEVVE
jgi:hypothetical protein